MQACERGSRYFTGLGQRVPAIAQQFWNSPNATCSLSQCLPGCHVHVVFPSKALHGGRGEWLLFLQVFEASQHQYDSIACGSSSGWGSLPQLVGSARPRCVEFGASSGMPTYSRNPVLPGDADLRAPVLPTVPKVPCWMFLLPLSRASTSLCPRARLLTPTPRLPCILHRHGNVVGSKLSSSGEQEAWHYHVVRPCASFRTDCRRSCRVCGGTVGGLFPIRSDGLAGSS